MNIHNTKLPPLPKLPMNDPAAAHKILNDYGKACANAAIEPYKQRIEELEAELQELQRQWVEHDTLGCPTAKTGIYAIDHARRNKDTP